MIDVLNLDADRCYANYEVMAREEAKREDKIDFVVIVTPNSSHYDICKAFIEAGIHIVCEKPVTIEYTKAKELEELAKEKNLLFMVTYVYSGHVTAKYVRELINSGEIGAIRSVMAEYPQGWLAFEDNNGGKQGAWRCDPDLSGNTNSLGDLGTHIENTVAGMTGLKIKKVLAKMDVVVPGRVYYKNVVYVNFETDEKIGSYFQIDIHPDQLIQVLEKYYRTAIVPGDTLIIFDEIQMCERALTSLKYFEEEAPDYHLVAAGSLLGVALNRVKYSFPVGKVQMITMYPMDLEEVLWAKGKELLADTIRMHFRQDKPMAETLHEEAMQEFYHYCIVGGMPAAVKADLMPNSPLKQDEIRQMLLNSYIADMTKYANKNETVRIYAAYDSLPAQLAKDSKKFQYKLIQSGARASQYGDALDWLIHSGVVHKCMRCSQGFFPSTVYQDPLAFKLYYSDMGIMSARMGMTLEALRSKESEHFQGILTENYVSIALKTNGYDLFYWESDNTAEVDFLIQKDSHVIPIECKAGNHVKAKSMMVYMEKYKPIYAIRISSRNFGMVKGIKAVPLYSIFCI